MSPVAVLCVDRLSVYWRLPGCVPYGVERDAYSFFGLLPVVAHPPCSQWSRLRSFSKENVRERELAFFCLEAVRRCGGVLEHPAGSQFFRGLPSAGEYDRYGGFTFVVDQSWFGFRARKRTLLYVVGVKANCLPAYQADLGQAMSRVDELWSGVRSRTTEAFATWLLTVARSSDRLRHSVSLDVAVPTGPSGTFERGLS